MKKLLFILLFPFLSCVTVDIEKGIRNESGAAEENGDGNAVTLRLPPELFKPEIVIVEKHVFIPQETQTQQQRAQAGAPAVQESNRVGIITPQDYSHAAMVYEYNPDYVYELYTQPLRVSDVCMQPGENITEPPFVSDSERWVLGAGVSYENSIPVQHVYIKPVSSGLSASLIINTDRRVYRIILRSFQNTHMPVVRWRYSSFLPNNYSQNTGRVADNADPSNNVDPRFLSFNYRVTYGMFRKPNWLPKLVFDDGAKTYITFDASVLHRELPVVLENRRDILNYRVSGHVIIIDKLIENITLRMGRSEITVIKKRK